MTVRNALLAAKGVFLFAAFGFFVNASVTVAADRPDIRSATRVDRGVALIIDDVQLAEELAGDGQLVVHLLTTRPERLAALREEVASQNLGGRVVVDVLRDDGRLPHPDRFVNLVVADLDALGERSPAREELLRVLATRGAACFRRGGKWEVARAEPDLPLGDWTHRWYNATGNCVSDDRVAAFPRAVQWQTGPAMEDGTADGKIPRIADGRWLIVDTSSGDLLCRDAGNGTLLWRKPLGLSASDDMAVVDGRIYLYFDPELVRPESDRRRQTAGPLVAIDLLTGDLIKTYDESLRAGTAEPIEFFQSDQDRTRRQTPVPWFVVSQHLIVQAYADELVVLDRQTGRRRWKKQLDDATWFSPVVSGNYILAAEAVWPARRGRHDGTAYVRAVTALAADTGEQLWRNADVHPQREVTDKQRRYLSRAEFKPLSVADGLVLALVSSYQFREGGSVAVLDLESGKQLWRHAFEPKQRYTQGSQRAVIRDGEVVVMDGLGALRFNARSGEPIGEPLDNKGGLRRLARANGACTASRATANWLICNAYLYVGPDGRPQPHFGTRGACGQGVVPAHGLIFVPPTPCDCGDYLRGHIALAPKMAGREIADESRLVRGPAYERPRAAGTAGGWPTFLGGPQRLSHSEDDLPATLTQRWSAKAATVRADEIDADRRMSERYLGALSAPVVSGGRLMVAAPEAHQVISVSASNGGTRWTFQAGGKVDSPPTLSGGLAVFGCDDGCVYAVRVEDGTLAWRFRAAGVDGVGMQHGHIASVHPLPGSVLVLDGKVVAVARHHTDLGGLHCWVLDLASGKPLAHRVIGPDQPRVVSNGVAVADEDGRGFWIGRQLHLSLELEDLDAHWFEGPVPPIAFDRCGTRMRFRTGEGRGGSTHGWKGAMAIPGRDRLLRAHRLAGDGETAFGLRDPEAGRAATPVVWATKVNEQENGLWMRTAEQLGGHESYGALIAAGRRAYLGGGSRNGRHGIVHAVDAGSGKLLATHSLPGRVAECGLAAANGCLYISCEDGSLICFGEAGGRNE
jgi:outer membrane protein assembly factor BamB